MSDYLDICLESGTTPNEDVTHNVIGGQIDGTELEYIRNMLQADYNLTLEVTEISDLMYDYGIDMLDIPTGVSIHDVLYDAMKEV
jgi:hypothetical protein